MLARGVDINNGVAGYTHHREGCENRVDWMVNTATWLSNH